MIKRVLVGALGVMLLTIGMAGASSGVASAAPCGSTKSPSVHGGQAGWSVRCVGSTMYFDGWVKDTDADGKCAHVVAFFPDGAVSDDKACPKGTITRYSYRTSLSGNIEAELRVY